MSRFLKKRDAARGQVPGELIFIVEQKVEEATIRLIDYDADKLDEKELQDVKDGLQYKETDTVTWININGLHDTELIRWLGDGFGLHDSRRNVFAHVSGAAGRRL